MTNEWALLLARNGVQWAAMFRGYITDEGYGVISFYVTLGAAVAVCLVILFFLLFGDPRTWKQRRKNRFKK